MILPALPAQLCQAQVCNAPTGESVLYAPLCGFDPLREVKTKQRGGIKMVGVGLKTSRQTPVRVRTSWRAFHLRSASSGLFGGLRLALAQGPSSGRAAPLNL